jgi:hypothetical protein
VAGFCVCGDESPVPYNAGNFLTIGERTRI